MSGDRKAFNQDQELYRNYVKPVLDYLLALLGLILTSPVFLLAVILLLFSNRGKVFFTQNRPGKGEKLFKLIKFKTMTDASDDQGELLPDEKRLTGVGKLIRKTSVDELPQLLNVLKGDISLIGPRPLLIEYLPLYNERQKRRHEVKPGITGWAQVNGRNQVPWEKRFEYDVWYVDHISFRIDLKIIFLTIWNIIRAKGIASETSATMEKFTGSKDR